VLKIGLSVIKMKCPKCKKEIEYLLTIGEENYSFELDVNDEPLYRKDNSCEGIYPFFCPECDEELFKGEEKAIKFLK